MRERLKRLGELVASVKQGNILQKALAADAAMMHAHVLLSEMAARIESLEARAANLEKNLDE